MLSFWFCPDTIYANVCEPFVFLAGRKRTGKGGVKELKKFFSMGGGGRLSVVRIMFEITLSRLRMNYLFSMSQDSEYLKHRRS